MIFSSTGRRSSITARNRRSVESRSSARVRACELLSPAGDWDCLRAAVENGADAVYFGLDCGFNARARAHNFPAGELPQIMGFLRARGVRGYVTLNTLAFSSELSEVESLVRRIAAAGSDAVLVQDLGVVRLIRAVCPDLAIHASTQMTLTSAECIQAAEMLGIERVVLARELSISEIRKIHTRNSLPLEAFVHGALCVAYSGQCLTSESLGGRSANRGQCAQACRLPYEVICDGRDVELADVKYLLSPQDLAAYALVPEMLAAGVRAFKIEGRLKSPEYVANITRYYRQAIDAALADHPVEFTTDQIREMELSFSRGFSVGWLNGCDHKMLVPGLSSAKRGVLLGTVEAVRGRRVAVGLVAPVCRGDGVVFAGDRAANSEQGGRVFDVRQDGRSVTTSVAAGTVELAFARHALDTRQLHLGQQVFKTDDPRLTRRLRKTFTGPRAVRRVALDLQVEAIAGERLAIRGQAASGATCHVQSDEPLAVARKHPLDPVVLRTQLGRLGASVYELSRLDARIEGEPMVPLSVLGGLRRQMISQLDDSIASPPPRWIAPLGVLDHLRRELTKQRQGTRPTNTRRPVLHVLCRSLDQLEWTLDCGVEDVYVDFQDIRQYAAAVETAHQRGAAIFLATARIQKPEEVGVFRALCRHGSDGILVRNLAGLVFFAERNIPLIADYSLNAGNELSVEHLRNLGARRVTASYDLNRDQLLDLVAAAPPDWLEVVVHQHMPMFHMEHCVFCAVLSPGTNKHNCGRPCDVHDVRLRDRIGSEHSLKADIGCRNTLYNVLPQSSAEIVPALVSAGVSSFRIELLNDTRQSIARTIHLYRELLQGAISGPDVWRELQALNRVGVTRGTLEDRRNPLAII